MVLYIQIFVYEIYQNRKEGKIFCVENSVPLGISINHGHKSLLT